MTRSRLAKVVGSFAAMEAGENLDVLTFVPCMPEPLADDSDRRLRKRLSIFLSLLIFFLDALGSCVLKEEDEDGDVPLLGGALLLCIGWG